jgi:hypothetical protein
MGIGDAAVLRWIVHVVRITCASLECDQKKIASRAQLSLFLGGCASPRRPLDAHVEIAHAAESHKAQVRIEQSFETFSPCT